MRNPIAGSNGHPLYRRCGQGPAFENPSYTSDPLGIQSRDEGALKIVLRGRWIVLHERIRHTKSNVGKPGFFAGPIQRQGKSVIDAIGGVPRFESCLVQQSYGTSKIPVL